ncbi:MAG: hypothetical protein LBJ03_03830, partial [Holosporales bacterium]|nr:hypothetical protein [Holosporales bacterium]
DNEPFLRQLEDLGFAVSRTAWSNYPFTIPSLSATMNMNCHDLSNTEVGSVVYSEQLMKVFRDGGPVCKTFRNNGYKIVYYPNHFAEAVLGNVDKQIDVSGGELYFGMLESTLLRFLLLKYQRYKNVEKLVEALDFYKDQPKFIFAHMLQVHDAIWDEAGETRDGWLFCFQST